MNTYIVCVGVISQDCNYEEWLEIDAIDANEVPERVNLTHKYDHCDITFDYIFSKECNLS